MRVAVRYYISLEKYCNRPSKTLAWLTLQITMVSTTDSKPRGYAFIEYEHERDMHCKLPLSRLAFVYLHAIPGPSVD